MATQARSPARSPTRAPAAKGREVSPQQLAERVKELESAEKEAKKAQTKEQKQRQRELADAKKKIAKELQAASRMVQKGEREANRLTTKADQVEKQAEQAKAKAARQQQMVDESLGRIHAKRNGLESTLHDKMSVIGEAKGRLAHVAFAAKMLEQGVIVAIDGTAEFDPVTGRPRARPRTRQVGANGEVLDTGDEDEEEADCESESALVGALREENRCLRERLDHVEAELARLRVLAGEVVELDCGPAQLLDGAHTTSDLACGFAAGRPGSHDLPQLLDGAHATCDLTGGRPGAPSALAPSASVPSLHAGAPAAQWPLSRACSLAVLGAPVGPSASGVVVRQVSAAQAYAPQQQVATLFGAPAQHPQHTVVAMRAPGVPMTGPADYSARSVASSPRAPQLVKPAAMLAPGMAPHLLANLRSLATPAKSFGKLSGAPPMEPVAVPPPPMEPMAVAAARAL